MAIKHPHTAVPNEVIQSAFWNDDHTGTLDHTTDLTNVGINTHAEIDTHIANNLDPHGIDLIQTNIYPVGDGSGTIGSDILYYGHGYFEIEHNRGMEVGGDINFINNYNLNLFNGVVLHAVDIDLLRITGSVDITGNLTVAGDRVQALPIGTVLMYDGVGIANVATRTTQLGDEPGDTITLDGWFVCNGLAGTPNILNKFIRGMSASGNTGGSDDAMAHTHVFTQPSSHAATACSRTTDVALTNNHSGGAVAAGGVDHTHGVSINSGWISADHNHYVVAHLYTSAGGYLYQQYVVHAWTCNLRNTASASGAYSDARDRGIVCSVGGVSANHYHYVGGNTGTASAYSHGHGFTQPSAHAITQPTFNTPVLSHSGGAVGAVNESLTGKNMPAYYSLIFIIRMS